MSKFDKTFVNVYESVKQAEQAKIESNNISVVLDVKNELPFITTTKINTDIALCELFYLYIKNFSKPDSEGIESINSFKVNTEQLKINLLIKNGTLFLNVFRNVKVPVHYLALDAAIYSVLTHILAKLYHLDVGLLRLGYNSLYIDKCKQTATEELINRANTLPLYEAPTLWLNDVKHFGDFYDTNSQGKLSNIRFLNYRTLGNLDCKLNLFYI